VFQRKINGLILNFYLAGINNQNFLMRDRETGTFWQQITGKAISGPLAGNQLTLVSSDELTFALWKSEQPNGTVLQDQPRYASEYSPVDWDKTVGKMPTTLSYAQAGLKPRDIMLGVHAFGAAKAFPYPVILKQKLIQDHLNAEPILVLLGPDEESVRVFQRRIPGMEGTPDFYRSTTPGQPFLLDAASGSEWNFQGCAISGSAKGKCLPRIDSIKDYWFDWRNYNAGTTVFGISQPIH
jgi:hypothetical protein